MSLLDYVTRGYAQAAADLIAQYDAVPSVTLYAPVMAHFPVPSARVLDVGAGNGRDAAWLQGLGYDVTAVDPVADFVAAIRERVPAARAAQDHLPTLSTVEGRFVLILVNGVWQHLARTDRAAAFRRLADLLDPEGRLILSLRHGPGHAARPVVDIDVDQTRAQAKRAGLYLLTTQNTGSLQTANVAAGVTWTWMVFSCASALA